jgi:hypothetical protein
MKRFLGFAVAMFFALVAIALVGGDTGAVAGHGCHGRKCHGGLMAKHRAKKAARKAAKCHGAEAAPACESGCGEAAPACEGGCGEAAPACEGGCGEAAVVEGGCSSCGGGEMVEGAVSGGCVGGGCSGESVISEGVPTEAAAPVAAPAAPASGT